MRDAFTERADWKGVALCFVVWAAHFLVLWGASSIFPGTATARWIALSATVIALGGLALLWRMRARHCRGAVVPFALALAVAAVLFGAMPAVVG